MFKSINLIIHGVMFFVVGKLLRDVYNTGTSTDLTEAVLSLIFGAYIGVLVHELGHYIFARISKFEIYHFLVGAGPVLYRIRSKHTYYEWRLFPVSGLVSTYPNLNNPTKLNYILLFLAGPLFTFLFIVLLTQTHSIVANPINLQAFTLPQLYILADTAIPLYYALKNQQQPNDMLQIIKILFTENPDYKKQYLKLKEPYIQNESDKEKITKASARLLMNMFSTTDLSEIDGQHYLLEYELSCNELSDTEKAIALRKLILDTIIHDLPDSRNRLQNWLKQAEKVTNTSEQFMCALGLVYIHTGNDRKGIQILEKLPFTIESAPATYALIHTSLAIAACSSKDFKTADIHLSKARQATGKFENEEIRKHVDKISNDIEAQKHRVLKELQIWS